MSLIIIIILLILSIFLFCKKKYKKENFNSKLLYTGIHSYLKDSYKYNIYSKKRNYLHLGKFADYIPLINHILL